MGEPEKKVVDNILEVKDLKVWFPVRKGVFGFITGYIKAVDGISFNLKRGETLGVVGESGCGTPPASLPRALRPAKKDRDSAFRA